MYGNTDQASQTSKDVSNVTSQASESKGTKSETKTEPKKDTTKTPVSSLAKKYSFFIPKKYKGSKSKSYLKRDGKHGLRSRLAYYDIDYSDKALAKYYKGMGLHKIKKGKKYVYGKQYNDQGSQRNAMLKWINKRGFARGVQDLPVDQIAWTQENAPETIIRRSDNAILTQLKRGDSVLNKDATNNIWSMANNPAKFIAEQLRLANLAAQVGTQTRDSNIQNSIDLDIILPNVSNYNEFMNAARSDPKFEKLIQAMTTDRLAGKGSYTKNSIKW